MHGHLCIMEFRKRGSSVASATSTICLLPYVREISRSLRWPRVVEPPPPRQKEERKTQSRQKMPLLPTSPEGSHKRPPMQGVLAAGRTGRWPDMLLEHAINKGLPGTCTSKSDSTYWSIRASGRLTWRRAAVDTSTTCLRLSPFLAGPRVLAPRASWWLRLCDHVVVAVSGADLGLCTPTRSR